MLSLHKQLPLAKADQERTILQRQIDTTDHQIDQLVYELYELTEEEIKIVEKTTKGKKSSSDQIDNYLNSVFLKSNS